VIVLVYAKRYFYEFRQKGELLLKTDSSLYSHLSRAKDRSVGCNFLLTGKTCSTRTGKASEKQRRTNNLQGICLGKKHFK